MSLNTFNKYIKHFLKDSFADESMTPVEDLLNRSISASEDIFQLTKINTSKETIHRNLGKGIIIADIPYIIVNKIVCGDKSDNIFPLIRWESKSRNYSLTEKMLDKAIVNMEETLGKQISYSDVWRKIIEKDDVFLLKLIKSLIGASKDTSDPDEKEILNHLYHNFKLVWIKGNIPENRVEEYLTLQQTLNIDFKRTLSVDTLVNSLNPETEILHDAATEIMLKSLL